jgi:CHASE1-domain containing sensor protein
MTIEEIKRKVPYVFVMATLCVGLAISVTAFNMVKMWEGQKLWMEFYQASENRHASLQREINSDFQALVSLQAFFLHSEKVTRAEFSGFTKSLLLQHTSVQAIEWIPRIPHHQREEFEKAVRKDGLVDFQITERGNQGKLIRAGTREEYFPVHLVEPYGSNQMSPGFDLASNPTIQQALEQSAETRGLVATPPLSMDQKSVGQPGFSGVFWVFAPVYVQDTRANSVKSLRENLRGFTSGFFRLDDVVRGSLEYLEGTGIDFYIYDQSGSRDDRFLYFQPARTRKSAISRMSDEEVRSFKGIKYSNTLNVAGRAWMVIYMPTQEFVAARQSWQPLYVLSVGLVLTGLFVSYLWFNIRRAEQLSRLNSQLLDEINERKNAEDALNEYRAHLEDLVSERTAELSRVNARLEQDIAERKKITEELQSALANIKTLKGLIPICAWCKQIRDDKGYWKKVETYIEEHSDASFTAGICPKCLHKEDPDTYEEVFRNEKPSGATGKEHD